MVPLKAMSARPSMRLEILMFIILKTVYFQLWFLCDFLPQENTSGVSELNTFNPRQTIIYSTLMI